ncbi:TetR/AcrR family transcriptional regulator [Paenibacillus lutrae]|uniref:TetR family transcriptional regulator n=1 Tax=Paenibacillus lutrae TaxID=2078573 RepID=A0A7X3FF10_9BACL|nr:TetR/AcrR family transcriptional regulator [Paenibacillus lutrae]MVO98498.1 TetR family transcriptional regulator [Paenibacillus lutrae]
MDPNSRRPPGRPRSNEQGAPVSDRILYVAMHEFIRHGYDAVSMDDIAKACGVTKASIYYYYPSKAVLLTQSTIRLMNVVRTATLNILQKPLPLRQRLTEVTVNHLKATTSFEFEGFMNKIEAVLTPEQNEEMRKAEHRLLEALADAFEEAARQGEICCTDSWLAARSYMALLMVGHSKQPDGSFTYPDKTQAAVKIIDMLWNGIGTTASHN